MLIPAHLIGVVKESDAKALLTEYWGLSALPAVERAEAQMKAEGREVAAKKLEAMRQTLIAEAALR